MNFHTADLCDEFRDEVSVLDPLFKSYGGKIKCSGEIVTVKLNKNNSALISLLKEKGKGRVAVVDSEAKLYAIVGENLMKLAYENGWSGILVNGYVRDTVFTKNIDVALFALGTYPKKSFENNEGKIGVDLNFAGVSFKNGYFLYADQDGIVISERELI